MAKWTTGAAVALLLVSGCAVQPAYYLTSLDAASGAVVEGPRTRQPRAAVVLIDKVDGKPLPAGRTSEPVVVEPGVRTLAITGTRFRGWLMDFGQAELRADLKAGRNYVIQIGQSEDELSFWVEDLATREVVSDRQTAAAKTLFKKR